MQLADAIKSRKSTKKFDGKKVDWKKIIRIVDVARLAPLAGNQNSVEFIFIQEKENIEKVFNASQQEFVRDAGGILVVVSDRKKVKKMYDYNDKGFAAQQAGAVIQNVLLLLTENKIDHCWVGFFDDKLMREATSVPEEKEIEAIIPLGFSAKNVKQEKKKKAELENIFYFEEYGNKEMTSQTRIRHDRA